MTTLASGPFEPTWESLKQYRIPDWYQDAKFGIFIHWGVYAVPAFGNEWYPRNMYLPGSPEYQHHLETYGPHTEFGYKDFIPQFKAEHYDPAAWARAVQGGRRTLCRARGRAPRRLRHVRHARCPSGARPRWDPSAT